MFFSLTDNSCSVESSNMFSFLLFPEAFWVVICVPKSYLVFDFNCCHGNSPLHFYGMTTTVVQLGEGQVSLGLNQLPMKIGTAG